jgi:hypothetical protein
MRHSSLHDLLAPPVASLLFVGNDAAEADAIRKSLTTARMTHTLHVALSCDEALATLGGDENNEPLLKPYVVLLSAGADNAVPFLRALRERHALRNTIVFVLAASSGVAPKSFYRWQIAGFVSDRGGELMQLLQRYLAVVSLPLGFDHDLATARRGR